MNHLEDKILQFCELSTFAGACYAQYNTSSFPQGEILITTSTGIYFFLTQLIYLQDIRPTKNLTTTIFDSTILALGTTILIHGSLGILGYCTGNLIKTYVQ